MGPMPRRRPLPSTEGGRRGLKGDGNGPSPSSSSIRKFFSRSSAGGNRSISTIPITRRECLRSGSISKKNFLAEPPSALPLSDALAPQADANAIDRASSCSDLSGHRRAVGTPESPTGWQGNSPGEMAGAAAGEGTSTRLPDSRKGLPDRVPYSPQPLTADTTFTSTSAGGFSSVDVTNGFSCTTDDDEGSSSTDECKSCISSADKENFNGVWHLASDDATMFRTVEQSPANSCSVVSGSTCDSDDCSSGANGSGSLLDGRTSVPYPGQGQRSRSASDRSRRRRRKQNFMPHNLSSIISDSSRSSRNVRSSESGSRRVDSSVSGGAVTVKSGCRAGPVVSDGSASVVSPHTLSRIRLSASVDEGEAVRSRNPVSAPLNFREQIYELQYQAGISRQQNRSLNTRGSTLASGGTSLGSHASIPRPISTGRDRIGMATPPWRSMRPESSCYSSSADMLPPDRPQHLMRSLSTSSIPVNQRHQVIAEKLPRIGSEGRLEELAALYQHPLAIHAGGDIRNYRCDPASDEDDSLDGKSEQCSTVSSLSISTASKSLAMSSVSMSFSLSTMGGQQQEHLHNKIFDARSNPESISVIILVMCAHDAPLPYTGRPGGRVMGRGNTRPTENVEISKFELLMVSFNRQAAVVRDLLLQLRPSVTDRTLRQQVYVGLCRPRPYGSGVDPGVFGADPQTRVRNSEKMINYFPTTSYDIKTGEILIAIPQGLDAGICAELAEPILNDPSVESIVDQILNSSDEKTEDTPPDETNVELQDSVKLKQKNSSAPSQNPKQSISGSENSEKSIRLTSNNSVGIQGRDNDTFSNNISETISSRRLHLLIGIVASCLVMFHNGLSSPLEPGNVLGAGKIRSRCGLFGLLPKSVSRCRQMTLAMRSDGALALYDSGPLLLRRLVWEMRAEGGPDDGRLGQPECTVDDFGRVIIGGQEASVELQPGAPLRFVTPWPFIIEPPKWRKMLTESGYNIRSM